MSNLVKKRITVKGRSGRAFQRSVLVRSSGQGTRKLSKRGKGEQSMSVSDHLRAYRNHAALNLGQGVRDAGLFVKDTAHHVKALASDTAYHAKRLAQDVYYGVTPPQWNGHTPAQVRRLARGSASSYYRRGKS